MSYIYRHVFIAAAWIQFLFPLNHHPPDDYTLNTTSIPSPMRLVHFQVPLQLALLLSCIALLAVASTPVTGQDSLTSRLHSRRAEIWRRLKYHSPRQLRPRASAPACDTGERHLAQKLCGLYSQFIPFTSATRTSSFST